MSITILPNTNSDVSNDFYLQHLVKFNITNVSVPLANSIRRILLSNIPSVAFDDTWNDDKDERTINIIKNTSGLHNEFLAHRLSLIPIHMFNDTTRNILKINTHFNDTTYKREFYFNSEDIPNFHLYIDVDSQSSQSKNRYGLFEVNISHIQYSPDYTSDIACSEYFQPDLHIKEIFKKNEYVILNMLKSTEELNIYFKPTIGLGKQNARYCSVGTVSYMFEIDNSKTEQVFQQSIEYANNERVQKKLNRLSEKEIDIKKRSFMVLDNERVYKTNKYNEANSFNFSVESIGILPSHQIVYDALTILKLNLYDMMHSFNKFEQYNNEVIYSNNHSYNDKISIKHSVDNLYGYKITIQNENHTLGNVINYYLNTLFVKNYLTKTSYVDNINDIDAIRSIPPIDISQTDLHTFKIPILEQCGYKMPHPLQEEIEFKIKIRNDISDQVIDELYQTYSLELIKLYNIQISEQAKSISFIDKRKTIVIYTFIKNITSILSIVSSLMTEWTTQTGLLDAPIDAPSFIISDPHDYFTVQHTVPEEAQQEHTTPEEAQQELEPEQKIELMETGGTVKRRKADGMRFK